MLRSMRIILSCCRARGISFDDFGVPEIDNAALRPLEETAEEETDADMTVVEQ